MTDREFVQTIIEIVRYHSSCDSDGCLIIDEMRAVVDKYLTENGKPGQLTLGL